MALPVRVDDGLWIVETRLRFLRMRVDRRESLIRPPGDGLYVHSPTELAPERRASLAGRGRAADGAPASNLHGRPFREQQAKAA